MFLRAFSLQMTRPTLLRLIRGLLVAITLLAIAAPQPEHGGLADLRAAEGHHAAGERSAAADAYRRAAAAFPKTPLPSYRLAALHGQWGYPTRGLTALEEATQLRPLPDEMQRLQMALLADAGRWETLTEAAQAYLADHPESALALAHLTEAQLHRPACAEAQSTAQTWRQVAPEDAAAGRAWGALALAETPAEAVTALCESDAALCERLATCADPAVCDLPLGQALLRQGERTLAACVLSRAVTAAPESGDAHALLGSTLDALGFSTEAGAHLAQATALSPGSPLAWTLRGQHHLRRGDYPAARKALRTAHELDPVNPAPCLAMAAALAGESRYDEIKPWIEAALERAPSDPEIHKAAARFYLTRNLVQETYPLQIAESAVALAPEDAEAQLLLGWSHLQSEKPQAALEALNRAATLHPALAQAHHLRGRALQALGRHDEAEAAFVKAVDLGYRE